MMLTDPANVEWNPHFTYPIHHAEHARLDSKQRQAVQHYAEMAKRLVRKRDHYRDRLANIPKNAFGVRLHPSADVQDEIFEMTHAFFEHAYATLSALASVHGRVKVFGVDPPISSVERFLAWWQERGEFLQQAGTLSTLLAARNFRTVLAHPQQKAVFDWGTRTVSDREIAVVLFGEVSAKGAAPEGAVLLADRPRDWEFLAPSMDDVVYAFMVLTSITFHVMPGTFPLEDGESTCTWEADGLGTSYWANLESEIARLARASPDSERFLDGA